MKLVQYLWKETQLQKMHISRILTSALVAGAMAIAMIPAGAQIITLPTQTFTGTTDFGGVFNFAQFNPALGSLLSVEIDMGTSYDSQITVTNSAESSSSGNVKLEIQDGISDGTFSNVSQILTVTGGTYSVTDDIVSAPGVYSLPSLGSTLLHLTGSHSTSGTFVNPVQTAQFIGLGTVGLNYATLTGTVLSNTGGNTNAGQVTSAAMTAKVIYTYDSNVPEPGAMALLGTGVVGAMGIAVRRRVLRKK